MNADPVIHIVDVIGLAAVEDFDVLLCPRHLGLGSSIHGVREGLKHAVVRNGNGLMSPRRSLFDSCGGVGQRIHGGHGGMQMQLHPLFRGGVLALGLLPCHDGLGLKHVFVIIAVVGHLAQDSQPHTLLDSVQNGFGLLRLHELVHPHRAVVICQIKVNNPGVPLFQLPVVHSEDLALHNDLEHIQGQVLHGGGISLEGAAEDGLLGFLLFFLLLALEVRRWQVPGRALAELLRLGKEFLLLLRRKSRMDHDGSLDPETLQKVALRGADVLPKLIYAIGPQIQMELLPLRFPAAAGQNAGGKGKTMDDELLQFLIDRIAEAVLRIVGHKLDLAHAVELCDLLHGLVDGLLGKVHIRLHLDRHGPGLGVDAGMQNPGSLKKRLSELVRLVPGKQF